MSQDPEAAKILTRAQELLRNKEVGSLVVYRSGRVGQPIGVFEPNGGLYSWFVPVTVDGLLAGFFEFRPDLTLMRYSSFQRQEESMEGCPTAEAWTDVHSIRRRIEDAARPDEKVGRLFLSYDRAPSHLAWMGVLESTDGTTRTLYVAGNAVWEASPPDDGEASFEGKQK